MTKRFVTAEELQELAKADPQGLLAAALRLAAQLQQRSGQLSDARDRIKELELLLEQSKKVALRQAAPFRVPVEKRVTTPKRPGRKAGHPGSCRPRPTQIDDDLEVALEGCPHCGASQWSNQQEIEQFIEDIPETRPHVTRLRTYKADCACCGTSVSSRHPLQVSQASNAAGVHLGPRALAIAADLNKSKCLTMRKTCAVLRDGFGLRLSPGGLSQALDRVAARAEPLYGAILKELLQAPAIHVDETSWWLNALPCWLWVFTHPQGTFYLISRSRGRDLLEAVIGERYPGVLVSDCLSVYDLETGEQQKCYSHHLKAIREAREAHPQAGEGFLSDLSDLLRRALDLGKAKHAIQAQAFAQQLQQLEGDTTLLLASPRQEPSEEAVRNRLLKQRDHLFTFLKHDGVDATNNLAERQLRPAVIARKLSCGNKTPGGAHTFEVLASIAASATQNDSNFIATIAREVPLMNST